MCKYTQLEHNKNFVKFYSHLIGAYYSCIFLFSWRLKVVHFKQDCLWDEGTLILRKRRSGLTKLKGSVKRFLESNRDSIKNLTYKPWFDTQQGIRLKKELDLRAGRRGGDFANKIQREEGFTKAKTDVLRLKLILNSFSLPKGYKKY